MENEGWYSGLEGLCFDTLSLNAESLSEYSLWESSDNDQSACYLDCKPEGQSHTVQRLNNLVIDGTRFGEGKLNICLQIS